MGVPHGVAGQSKYCAIVFVKALSKFLFHLCPRITRRKLTAGRSGDPNGPGSLIPSIIFGLMAIAMGRIQT